MPIDDLHAKPAYQIRRLRQIAAALFAREAAPYGITSQQYTTLRALHEYARLEQNEICDAISLDRSTVATLLARLEEKDLVRRTPVPGDRRRKHVSLTPRGRRLLAALEPSIEVVQDRILAPLAPAERAEFTRMLATLVRAHTDLGAESAASTEEAS